MGVHAAGTQQGLSYRLAPLEGKRAGALKALMSRAPAANVPFPALQSLIWQIAGGLGYARMPRQSQLLVDQLIPDFRNELNEDFVVVLQQKIDQLKRVQLTARFANELQSLLTEYERVQQNLQRNADNFENLSRQFVNVIPGTAPNAGPSSWSKLNSRVYARLTGGNVYGQVGNLEIRVLSSHGVATSSRAERAILRNASYLTPTGTVQAITEDQAEVPLNAVIAYPNSAPGMQGLMTGIINNPNPPPVTSSGTIWVANVQPSFEAATAGSVTLGFNAPNASACKLSVTPSIQNIPSGSAVSVPCTGSDAQWTGTLPPNSSGGGNLASKPLPYTFKLAGTGISPQDPPSVTIYTLPRIPFGTGGQPFASLITAPARGPCGSSFPQLNCWWPFGYAAGPCPSSNASCASNHDKALGKASLGIFAFGVLGKDHVEDSLTSSYGGSFPLPQGYAEHLAVDLTVSYKEFGACFAAVGLDVEDFQIAVADNVSEIRQYPPSAPTLSCVGLLGTSPLLTLIQNGFNATQLADQAPKLLSDINSLQTAYQKQDVSSEAEDLSNVLSDLNALSSVPRTGRVGFGLATESKTFSVAWTPTIDPSCAYTLTISPIMAWAEGGGGLVFGQELNTISSATIAGIATPRNQSVPACLAQSASAAIQFPANASGLNRTQGPATFNRPVQGSSQPDLAARGANPSESSSAKATAAAGAPAGTVSISVVPNIVSPGGQAMLFGIVHDASGKPIVGAAVELTATAEGATTAPSALTTDANGAFSAPFTVPPTPGVVTFRATVNGSSPPVVATATLKVGEATGKQSNAIPHTNTKRPQTVAPSGSAVKGGIRSVDFNNFDYPSKYCVESDAATEKTIHVSKGSWTEGDLQQGNYGYFAVAKVAYADLKGDGSEEAVVHTLCNTGANFSSHEILIYETSPDGPRLFAKLSDSDWGAELMDFQVSKKYLDVNFPDGGSHACPDWLVTGRFQWNGTRFVKAGQPTRKPYICK